MNSSVPAILQRHRLAILVLCVVAWIGAFTATHLPPQDLTGLATFSDKVLHKAGFFILTSLYLLTLTAHKVGLLRRVALTTWVIASYAAIDEITQQLVSRDPDVYDWFSDLTGMAVAIVLCEVALALASRRAAPSAETAQPQRDRSKV